MFPSKEVVRRLIRARRHIGRWRYVPPVRETRKWLQCLRERGTRSSLVPHLDRAVT